MQTVISPDDRTPAFDYVSNVDVPKLDDTGAPMLDKDGDPVTEKADVGFHNGDPIVAGQEIQVSDEIAESLIAQGWHSARSRGARVAAKERKKNEADESADDPADAGTKE